MIVHCQLRIHHLSTFTFVFQRELNDFTLVGGSGQKKIYIFYLQVEEIPYCSVRNVTPLMTWVTFPGQF